MPVGSFIKWEVFLQMFFQVLNLVQVQFFFFCNDTELKPGDQVSIQGDAVEVNGQSLDGMVGLNVLNPREHFNL